MSAGPEQHGSHGPKAFVDEPDLVMKPVTQPGQRRYRTIGLQLYDMADEFV